MGMEETSYATQHYLNIKCPTCNNKGYHARIGFYSREKELVICYEGDYHPVLSDYDMDKVKQKHKRLKEELHNMEELK